MKRCICLCMALFLMLSAIGAHAEEQAFIDLRYTLPEGWTQALTDSSATLSYSGSNGESGMILISSQDMSMFANAGLDTPMMAEMYLQLLIEALFESAGVTAPDVSTSLLIDGQTAVRYPMQNGDTFIDALAVLYNQTAYVVLAMGSGQSAYAGYEVLTSSLNFGGASAVDVPTQEEGEVDLLAALSDEDVALLRDRAVQALGAEEIALDAGEYTVGEDIPTGSYLLVPAGEEIVARASIESRDETIFAAEGGTALCRFLEGDVVEISSSAVLRPYLNTLTSTDVQRVGNVEFLLPSSWEPSMEDGYFYAYTEADRESAECGRLLSAMNTLPDSDVQDPEALLNYLASPREDETLTSLYMTKIEGRPAIRYSCVGSGESVYASCTEGLFLLDGNDLYTFLIVGQSLFEDVYAHGFDLLLDTVTFEGIEPLPELSAQVALNDLSASALQRIYTLCDLRLMFRGDEPSMSLPMGYFMVGVDVPAGSYSASTSGMCIIGCYDYALTGSEPTPVVLRSGQVIDASLKDALTLTRQ